MRTVDVHPALARLDGAVPLHLVRAVAQRRLDRLVQNVTEAFWDVRVFRGGLWMLRVRSWVGWEAGRRTVLDEVVQACAITFSARGEPADDGR